MGGLALWLLPKADSPFTKTAQELIDDTVPRQFVSADQTLKFPPHITLTSDISPDSIDKENAQSWIDKLPLPDFKAEHNEVLLELDTVEAEDPFFRKMNISVKDNANLRKLAAVCRSAGGVAASEAEADKWSQTEYRPHMSLFYGDLPTKDVKGKIPLIEMKIGFALGDLFACCGGALCLGGDMVLVDTTRPVGEWKDSILARRQTPWAMWRGSRNLL